MKEEMFGDGSKTKPHWVSGCAPDQTNFLIKTSMPEKADLVCRASDGVLGADQVIFLDYHLEIYLTLSQRNKCNEKIKDA